MQLEYRSQVVRFENLDQGLAVFVAPPATGDGQEWTLLSITPMPVNSFESVSANPHYGPNGMVAYQETSRSRYSSEARFLYTWMRQVDVAPDHPLENTY